MKTIILILFCVVSICASEEVIDISVKGISDEKKDGAQKDRMEAIMDAKRQACEKAGIKIKSESKVENFQLTYDLIESKAEGVLMPGFQIIDVGYTADGPYNVVLVGKLKIQSHGPLGDAAYFTLIINFRDKKEKTKQSQLFDKLYRWLDIAHAKFDINGKNVDELEDNLIEISKTDSVYYGDTRIYAFKYELPAGNLMYEQRTPNNKGTTSDHDFKIKLRSGLQYIMMVAHPNALYFSRPMEFEGVHEKTRNFRKFPEDFSTVIYKK